MKVLFLLNVILIGITNISFGQSVIGEIPPDKYFDFWVGTWELNWTMGNGQIGAGINNVHKTLDETVIQENFEATEGRLKGFKGKSFSVYNPRKKSWHQAWVDNQGSYINLEGRIEGEQRIFQTGMVVTANGDSIMNRMVFYDIEEDSFTWDWEYSNDRGKNWILSWQILYQRLE